MSRLLTEEIRKALPKLREQEGSDDPVVYAKFFYPASCWTWFVTEGQPEGDDFTFFGYVIGFEEEFGYFSLRALEEVIINGIAIERDCYFEPGKLSACLDNLRVR